MCRLLAYRGPSIDLAELILRPHHSLYKQSWQPKETNYAMLNADGFGFGWYDQKNIARTYRNPLPIWSDVNLPALSETLHAKIWFAMVRSATENTGVSPYNLQPFVYQNYMFMHNGFVRDFKQGGLQKILATLPSHIIASIEGLTDSAYLFGLVCFFLEQEKGDMESALQQTLQWCQIHLSEHHAMLNMIVTDGNTIVAVRAAMLEEPPTLYTSTTTKAQAPLLGEIFASEPFSDQRQWQAMQENEFASFTSSTPQTTQQ